MNVTWTDAPMIPAPTAEALVSNRGSDTWSLQSHLDLTALPGAVPCARHHARRMLAEWHLDDSADVIELVVCELVTNAVRACAGMAPGGLCMRLWLCSDGYRVIIQVWDASDRMPVRQCPVPGAESGRGLVLVDSLSEDWGAYRPAALSGKVVWAIVAS